MKTMRTIMLSAFMLALGALGVEPAAEAQNALGDGRALDANLRVGSGGRNPARRDFASELRFRNAIVTGNVPGGFSFRGSVGYTAADDFRGDLGSNDIFDFQRDSLTSSLVGSGFRGTDALKLQMSLQMGGQGAAGSSPLIVRRAGTGASLSGGRVSSPTLDSGFATSTGSVDPYALPSGLLRSTSDYISTNAISLRVLGETQAPREQQEQAAPQRPALPLPGIDDERSTDFSGLPRGPKEVEQRAAAMVDRQQRLFAVASPLLGVSVKETPQYLNPTASNRLESTRLEGRVDGQVDEGAPTRIDSRVTYDDFLEGLERQAIPGAEEQGEEERPAPRDPTELLEPELPEEGRPEGADEAGPSDEFARRLDRLARSLAPESAFADDAEGEEAEEPLRGEALREEARALLGSEEFADIETLAPPTPADQRNLYLEHMTVAEEALRDGRYFDAEERFASAMRIRENDAMAAAGRVNAQIGAGMFLSAAVNLSQLFRAYPELIPARFDEQIMPDRERLEIIRGELRRHFGRSTELARRAALLYAYVSHQLRDRDGVEEGFAEIARITAERDEELDPLHDALRVIWIKSRR